MRLTHSQYTQNVRKWRHVRDPGSRAPGKPLTKNGNQTKNYGGALKQTKIAVLVYLNGEISYSIVSIFLFSANLCCVTHLEQIQFTFFHLLRFPLNFFFQKICKMVKTSKREYEKLSLVTYPFYFINWQSIHETNCMQRIKKILMYGPAIALKTYYQRQNIWIGKKTQKYLSERWKFSSFVERLIKHELQHSYLNTSRKACVFRRCLCFNFFCEQYRLDRIRQGKIYIYFKFLHLFSWFFCLTRFHMLCEHTTCSKQNRYDWDNLQGFDVIIYGIHGWYWF